MKTKRCVGTVIRGIRTPIIKKNDNLVKITIDSLLEASKYEGFTFKDRDIIALTEGIVAKAQGNYVTIDDIAIDIKQKYPNGHIGIVYPILSRNRFALCLKGIARGCRKITLLLSYPTDEVGNPILDCSKLDKNKTTITETEYNQDFSNFVHPFTGVNMVSIYRELVEQENCEIEFIFNNEPTTILNYTKDILVANIHIRKQTKSQLLKAGGKLVYDLSEIMNKSINGSGYNKDYGLLGSNRATETTLKLFPTQAQKIVDCIQKEMQIKTGKTMEVLIYGDGAFKDPVSGIWELADPVVAPFFTKGLKGTPNELKLKYIADNKYNDLKGSELQLAVKKEIKAKKQDLKGTIETQGTTPRQITDLLGSLCDLTSGSGDKGTPLVFIQGYFDDYASN